MPLLLLVCLLLAACGADPSPASAPPAPGPPVLGHVGVTSLLAMADRMRVDAAPEGFEPQIRHMRPGAGHAPEREPLPCIRLRLLRRRSALELTDDVLLRPKPLRC